MGHSSKGLSKKLSNPPKTRYNINCFHVKSYECKYNVKCFLDWYLYLHEVFIKFLTNQMSVPKSLTTQNRKSAQSKIEVLSSNNYSNNLKLALRDEDLFRGWFLWSFFVAVDGMSTLECVYVFLYQLKVTMKGLQ